MVWCDGDMAIIHAGRCRSRRVGLGGVSVSVSMVRVERVCIAAAANGAVGGARTLFFGGMP